MRVEAITGLVIVILAALLAVGAVWTSIDENHQQTARTCINQHLSAEQCQAFGRLP